MGLIRLLNPYTVKTGTQYTPRKREYPFFNILFLETNPTECPAKTSSSCIYDSPACLRRMRRVKNNPCETETEKLLFDVLPSAAAAVRGAGTQSNVILYLMCCDCEHDDQCAAVSDEYN